MSIERTRSHRLRVHWRCFYRLGQGPVRVGQILNVAPAGVLLETRDNLPLGSKLTLKLDAVHRGTVLDFVAQAEVRHSAIHGDVFDLGLSWESLQERDAQLLQDVLKGKP